MDFISGNIYFRYDEVPGLGPAITQHDHTFDHTTLFWRGWWLVTWTLDDGSKKVAQFAAESYVRQPDEPTPYQNPDGTITFVNSGDTPPAGATEIPYEPVGFFVRIAANSNHAFTVLGNNDPRGAAYSCAYSHREPQDALSTVKTGWETAGDLPVTVTLDDGRQITVMLAKGSVGYQAVLDAIPAPDNTVVQYFTGWYKALG